MEREIKFRVWEKYDSDYAEEIGEIGEMHYTELGDEKRFVSIGFYHDSGWDHDDFTWLQCTGLKDKNGKEIYEGDVVEFEETQFESGMLKCEMVFFRGMFCARWEHGYIPVWDFMRDFELIGNIYENPELIEK